MECEEFVNVFNTQCLAIDVFDLCYVLIWMCKLFKVCNWLMVMYNWRHVDGFGNFVNDLDEQWSWSSTRWRFLCVLCLVA